MFIISFFVSNKDSISCVWGFLDFLPDHALHTAKGLLGEGDLVIRKAFTKLYGMAGVRLGLSLIHI